MSLYVGLMVSVVVFGAIHITPNNSINDNIHSRKAFCMFFFFILWVLMALKGSEIGSDTPAYIRFFESCSLWVENVDYSDNFIGGLFENASRFEIGYVLLNKIVAFIFDDVQWLFIIVASFCMIVCCKLVLEKSDNVWLSIYLFIALRLYYFTLSGLRQSIAIFVCVIAYGYIKKRKLIPFILLVALAALFHMSAIVFLIAYPLSFFKFNGKTFLFFSFAGLFAFLFFDRILSSALSFLPDYYSHYTTSVERFAQNKLGNILVGIIQALFIFILVFSQYNKEDKGKIDNKKTVRSNTFNEESMLSFMILISCLCSVISLRATILDRLYYYFWIYSIVYIPNVLAKIKDDKTRNILKILVIIFTFIYNITLLYLRPEWTSITPYKFFWQ